MGINLFGRNYTTTGSSDSDFLIKTKGAIKIQWGSKFIDLIKNGKINADSSVIYSIKSKDKIGVSDGIYVTDDGEVYLKVNNNEITLVGGDGATFVSFLAKQTTTAEQKYNAMQNVGFMYSNLTDLTEDSLQNGIVYIESEQKLYIIIDGTLKEYTAPMSSHIYNSFIITKSDSSKGSLVIQGQGIENSIAFDSLYIYNEIDRSTILSNLDLVLQINDTEAFIINEDEVTAKVPLIAPSIKSNNFEVSTTNYKTTLKVDNIETNKISLITNEITMSVTDSWSNSTLLDDYTIYTVDEDNAITGTPTSDKFIAASGTTENWANSIWKINFLEVILANFLNENSTIYSDDTGWNIYNNYTISSTSKAGYWTAKISESEYVENTKSTLNINNLSGEVFDENRVIQFNFTNIKVGEPLNLKFGDPTQEIGDYVTCDLNLYNIKYDKCYYKITTLSE